MSCERQQRSGVVTEGPGLALQSADQTQPVSARIWYQNSSIKSLRPIFERKRSRKGRKLELCTDSCHWFASSGFKKAAFGADVPDQRKNLPWGAGSSPAVVAPPRRSSKASEMRIWAPEKSQGFPRALGTLPNKRTTQNPSLDLLGRKEWEYPKQTKPRLVSVHRRSHHGN